jgi:hypothetical protein
MPIPFYQKYISEYKDTKVLCFDLVFDCNVSLPPYIGLGKHASTGFGIVRGINQKNVAQKNYNL